ncbi:MAG: hypothetical protein JWQ29_2383 [Phenylobacterium sp.]|nr:hypothetical protein [Phenylobacterium sp.]
MKSHRRFHIGLLGCLAAVLAAGSASAAAPPVMTVLSSPAAMVSGGDALVRISPAVPGLTVRLNGRDITTAFRPDPKGGLTGLVFGLALGANRLEASGKGGARLGALVLTDHPVSGPIVSGPQMQPFICQTASFKLPDGTTLGPPTDAACSAPTKVSYVYMPRGGTAFKPLPSPTALPADVAQTTTLSGAVVPFVVRLETAVINRGVHQNAVLFDPTAEAQPTPFAPPKAWNHRLIAVHGVGCPAGWYIQGSAQGEPILDAARLGEGYAMFTNTLRHPTNSCNAFLAGETTMMDKEHVIETFGVPDFTVSKGSSGGAYTSLQVADAFPGLFDGVMFGSTFPDALSIALSGLDAHLLTHDFAIHNDFTDAQKAAISGFKNVGALIDAANQAQRTDPVAGRDDIAGYKSAVWNPAVPAGLRYDPVKTPHGARPTVFDAARNIYGVDPATGFALRPFDNVGVQYGLAALNAGAITPDQFIALNARIGGYDRDANYVARRSVGDAGAIKRAQQTGLALGGGGGLASIPVFDTAVGGVLYDEGGGYHYQWYHFAVRERLRQANGDAANHVMWRGGLGMAEIMKAYTGGAISPEAKALTDTATQRGWSAFIQWVAAAKADPSPISQRAKTLKNKPADLVDGCWMRGAEPKFVAEPQTWGAKPDSRCNATYPSYSFARKEAGGPLAANIYKCALRPVRAAGYRVKLSPDHLQRLRAVFPGGVCDFEKPGVGQTGVVPQDMAAR